MKRPITLIREYESQHPPLKKSARMYGLVKPIGNGEFNFEVHAVINSTRKGEKLMSKCVFKMNSASGMFKKRDILWYSNWSPAAPKDHWVVDFHESGRGERYMERANMADEFNKWTKDYASLPEWIECRFPFATMLNGFENTRYQYCGYNPESELSVFEYLSLWAISPKVELISKAGLFNLLNEESVVAFADNPEFAKWLAKNVDTARSKRWNLRQCKYHYGKAVNTERLAIIRAEQDEARSIAQKRNEEKRIRDRIKKTEQYNKKILELYHRLRSICGMNECYEVYIPKSNKDLVIEGERMHNCVGLYHVSTVAEGSEIMVFLRKNGKPYIDIAISTETFSITEMRRICNASVSKEEENFGKKLADQIKTIYKAA